MHYDRVISCNVALRRGKCFRHYSALCKTLDDAMIAFDVVVYDSNGIVSVVSSSTKDECNDPDQNSNSELVKPLLEKAVKQTSEMKFDEAMTIID